MNEWNVIHENFHTKHSVLTAPDEHMPYIIQLHIMSIRWAYYEQTVSILWANEAARGRDKGRGERENLNTKTLFYKDCSLGSVKNLSNN